MISNFDIGQLARWKPVGMGELLAFDLVDGFRAVSFDLIADERVIVRAITQDQSWTLAVGEGLMTISFTAIDPIAVVVEGPNDAQVHMRTNVEGQIVPETLDPSFTVIEPRVAGPSDEIKRMMHLMKLNMRQREAQIRAEYDARHAVIEEEQPAPQPAPAPSGEVQNDQ